MREGILFRPRARDDLESHVLWIGRKSEEEARAFMDAVELTLKQLSDSPESGEPRDWLLPYCHGLRLRSLRNSPEYLLCYRPVGRGIEVIRILHVIRDIGPLPNSPY